MEAQPKKEIIMELCLASMLFAGVFLYILSICTINLSVHVGIYRLVPDQCQFDTNGSQ
jgi:hypothetical protein